jgi:hypothetical protein
MGNRAEVREFLISRRAKITPGRRECPTSEPGGRLDCAGVRLRLSLG